MRDIYPFLRKLTFRMDYTDSFSVFGGVIHDFLLGTENLLCIMWKSAIFWV